jgi:hypothetical protein
VSVLCRDVHAAVVAVLQGDQRRRPGRLGRQPGGLLPRNQPVAFAGDDEQRAADVCCTAKKAECVRDVLGVQAVRGT